MVLDKDFKEFIELLNKYEVHYLVIGGYAVNFHGYPRYTKDIDFWIWLKDSNIQNLLRALSDFGFGSLGLTENDFKLASNIIQLGYEPYRIDLLMEVEAADFETCYARKMQKVIDNVAVDFLELNDLITIKKNAGRLQDLADAEQLEKISRKKKKSK
ncbi:MAG: hypothetical protein RLZZ628_1033 [Bacteroidota bacterium]|jgi:predicted nucleotidyltransferase